MNTFRIFAVTFTVVISEKPIKIGKNVVLHQQGEIQYLY
jgi:hypothetical protein